MPAEEAVTHHRVVADDLLEAFDSVRPLSWEHRSQKVFVKEPGAEDCRYQAGVWESEEPLYPEPGEGMDWEPWRGAVDPVLEEHGFDPLGREKRSGAELRVESEGPHGARLVLRADGSLLITGISIDAHPCEDSALGL